ncbi:unnamed protein product [Caenorhabditis nigoni]
MDPGPGKKKSQSVVPAAFEPEASAPVREETLNVEQEEAIQQDQQPRLQERADESGKEKLSYDSLNLASHEVSFDKTRSFEQPEFAKKESVLFQVKQNISFRTVQNFMTASHRKRSSASGGYCVKAARGFDLHGK